MLAKAQKLVEHAVLAIATLESGGQYWNWQAVCEQEIVKFCMQTDKALATIHLTLSTNLRTNLHLTYPTLKESWRLLKLHQFFELICQICLAPSRAEYTRGIPKSANQHS